MKNNDLNGIIIIDKPSGMTSRDVVNVLNKALNTKKVGHTGTLDPIASGVLICTVGKCTKLDEYLTSKYKTYEVKFTLGYETDTLDITGKTLFTSDREVAKEKIENTIKSFEGNYLQEVPMYSAVKIGGKKLYEYARNGETVDLPKREVTIKDIKDIKFEEDIISFTCTVSKGTYIRSLIRDIGRKLDTYAVMTDLRRITQGTYSIEDAYSLEDIKQNEFELITPEEIFKDLPCIECDAQKYKEVSNGVHQFMDLDSEYIIFKYNGLVVALYKLFTEGEFRMNILF